MVARKIHKDGRQSFVNKLSAQAERHQARMIKRRIQRGLDIPLHWLSPAYWWMARCGWVTKELAPHFEEIWRWWQTLDITAQYALMRASRSRDFD